MIQIEKDKIYSYKELCESIKEQAAKGGTQRKAQEKRINRFYKLEKIGRKFRVVEIYQEPKKIIDNRESSFDKCPTLQILFPYFAGAIVKKNKKTGKVEDFSKEITRTALLEYIFGVNCIVSEEIIENVQEQLPIASQSLIKYMAGEFTNKLSSFFWNSKLKSGCINKLNKLGIGDVKEYYYLGILEEFNNDENTEILKRTKYKEQTEAQHNIIKKIEKSCMESFDKKSVALFSSQQKHTLNKLIRNKLGFKDDIFYFTKYKISINMTAKELNIPSIEEYKQLRKEIFCEFYNRYILKYKDEDVTKFSVFVKLFNYYLYKNSIVFDKSWMPINKSERKIYQDEIKKLEKGIKELKADIKHLQNEMQEIKFEVENSN